ncbi:MBL fold metallo-hydrolase [Aestuariibaculum marinum]|uniref:MBL fold metallo-hydrolase n=1 Tax=Aestuariibaculum marinum TaxID=2683592 RepID=A0A8J6U9W8_9FLAO|nr:MBL fold metallo-hydrolase [Aestuariibaculum marinum]MBD0822613.1 MBL fold metallo-hydrolase [Aestuariibaculum marinum]
MELKILGTGSKGNAYILENENESLLIECGLNIKDIKAALNFNFSKVVGCILSHEHGDHAKSAKELMASGVNVFSAEGTHKALGTISHHRASVFQHHKPFALGNFKIMAFDVLHDAAQPSGFLINHPDTGKILFLTDLIFSAYTFKELNNIIIEANYDEEIARSKLNDMEFLRNRIIKSHMSLDTCIKTLQANDLSAVNNIVLIHLSDSNSDEKLFSSKVYKATGKTVTVADNGLVIDFNKTPF